MSTGLISQESDANKSNEVVTQNMVIGGNLVANRIGTTSLETNALDAEVGIVRALNSEDLVVDALVAGEGFFQDLEVKNMTIDTQTVINHVTTNITTDNVKISGTVTFCPGGAPVTPGSILTADAAGNLTYSTFTGGAVCSTPTLPVQVNSLTRWGDTIGACLDTSTVLLESNANNLYMGQDASVLGGMDNLVLGTTVTAPADSNNVSVGFNNTFSGSATGRRVAVGNSNTVASDDCVVVGINSTGGATGIVVGNNMNAAPGNSIALGHGTSAPAQSIVVGHGVIGAAAGDIYFETGAATQRLVVDNLENAVTGTALYYNPTTNRITQGAASGGGGVFSVLANDNVVWDTGATPNTSNLVLGPATAPPPAGVTGALISGGTGGGGENTITDAMADNSVILGGINNTLNSPNCAIVGSENVTVGAANRVVVVASDLSTGGGTIGGQGNFVAACGTSFGSINISGVGNTVLSSNNITVANNENLIYATGMNGITGAIAGNQSVVFGVNIGTAVGTSRGIVLGNNVVGLHNDIFLWCDGSSTLTSSVNQSFAVRATGGVRFEGNTSIQLPNVTGAGAGQVLTSDGSGTGTWQDRGAVGDGAIHALAVYDTNPNGTSVNDVSTGGVASAILAASSGTGLKLGPNTTTNLNNFSTIVGASADSSAERATCIGYSAVVSGGAGSTRSTVVGESANTNERDNVCVGQLTSATDSNQSVAVGGNASVGSGAASNNGVAIGYFAQVGNTTASSDSVAIGQQSRVDGPQSTAVGSLARVEMGGSNSTMIGYQVSNLGDDCVGIGHNITLGAVSNQIAIGKTPPINVSGNMCMRTGLAGNNDRLFLPNLVGVGTSGYVLTADAQGQGTWGSVGAAAYTASNPGDWNGAAPTTIQDAIDRLAAAFAANAFILP